MPFSLPIGLQTMTHDEQRFFRALGARIATLRKDQGMTQVQLAERLDITQQMVASYEVGRRRIPVSMLLPLATALSVPVEILLGVDSPKSGKRGPTPKLQQQMERLSRLPKAKQQLLMDMIDGVIKQAS